MDVDRNGMVVLSEDECFRRLGFNGIGRVAVTVGALPTIFPVGYAVHERAVYFRTARGTKLTAAVNGAVIAFEVDHVDTFSHCGWSVVIIGPSALVPAHTIDAPPRVPRWLESGPDHLVRIRPGVVSGREINHTLALSAGMLIDPKGEECVAPSR